MANNLFYEKKLEDIIFDNRDKVKERGLDIFYEQTVRQFLLPNGRKIDILTWEIKEGKIYFRIIELKKENIDEPAYWQIIEYFSEFAAMLGGYFKSFYAELILIGVDIEYKVKTALWTTNSVRHFNYYYDFDGIKFMELKTGNNNLMQMFSNFIADEDYKDKIDILQSPYKLKE